MKKTLSIVIIIAFIVSVVMFCLGRNVFPTIYLPNITYQVDGYITIPNITSKNPLPKDELNGVDKTDYFKLYNDSHGMNKKQFDDFCLNPQNYSTYWVPIYFKNLSTGNIVGIKPGLQNHLDGLWIDNESLYESYLTLEINEKFEGEFEVYIKTDDKTVEEINNLIKQMEICIIYKIGLHAEDMETDDSIFIKQRLFNKNLLETDKKLTK